MNKQVIEITKDKLERYADYLEEVQDYPLYGHTSNLTRSQIVVIAELLQLELDNETTGRVTVETT